MKGADPVGKERTKASPKKVGAFWKAPLPLHSVAMLCAALRRIFFTEEVTAMETRVALIAVIVENPTSTEKLNAVLHEYRDYIIGRMGIPYREKKISVMSIVVDAPNDVINALSGRVGRLDGVTAKTICSNV